MNKRQVVYELLRSKNWLSRAQGFGWAPSNLALSKYWGKRNTELNLPFASSLSVSLGLRGACTTVSVSEYDACYLNDQLMSPESSFVRRMQEYLALFKMHHQHFVVHTKLNIPLAAGLASSACGFAALVLALNDLYGWQLSTRELSILARLGSGSACRSLTDGFVLWQSGKDDDGLDSYGIPIQVTWPELCIGLLIFDHKPKTISSRQAMAATVATSPLYGQWIKQTQEDTERLYETIIQHNFTKMGEIAERNALAMHAAIRASVPSINYSTWETVQTISKVQHLRQSGVEVYLTQDAGANVQLLFTTKQLPVLNALFPEMQVVLPFNDYHQTVERLDEQTHASLGLADKLLTHQKGDLHRAFSVVITRKNHQGVHEILLQQRSQHKYHSAGKWSNACCGHPTSYDSLLDDAKRRFKEEMGVNLHTLQEIGSFVYRTILDNGLIEYELDHVLWAAWDERLMLAPNELEVSAYNWVNLGCLQQRISQEAERYSSWLPSLLQIVQAAILSDKQETEKY